jgi:hypothetical protein
MPPKALVSLRGQRYLRCVVKFLEDAMSSALRSFTVFVLLLILAKPIWADACFPRFTRRENYVPRVEPEYDLVIVRDPDIKEAELRIPRRLLVASASVEGPTHTAMAGLALSAAIVAGGLWCVSFRGRRVPKKKLLVAGALVGLLLAGVVFVNIANADVPPLNQVMGITEVGAVPVKVVMVEQGDAVQLFVPPALADRITGR